MSIVPTAAPSIIPHSPITVLAHFDGNVEQRTLIALMKDLRRDPNWRATLIASNRRCDVNLIYWPTGARYHIPLQIVSVDASPVWRRSG